MSPWIHTLHWMSKLHCIVLKLVSVSLRILFGLVIILSQWRILLAPRLWHSLVMQKRSYFSRISPISLDSTMSVWIALLIFAFLLSPSLIPLRSFFHSVVYITVCVLLHSTALSWRWLPRNHHRSWWKANWSAGCSSLAVHRVVGISQTSESLCRHFLVMWCMQSSRLIFHLLAISILSFCFFPCLFLLLLDS